MIIALMHAHAVLIHAHALFVPSHATLKIGSEQSFAVNMVSVCAARR